MKEIPIFITTKDRKSCLQRVIEKLTEQGYHNLHVIDTGSTWSPMIVYLRTIKFPVFHVETPPLPKKPKYSLWNAGILKLTGHENDWFVLTDDDIIPDGPDNWCEVLRIVLLARPEWPKAGLALRIDDLPDHYAGKSDVLKWEAKFWTEKVSPSVYVADVDTTMALYRPGTGPGFKALRIGGQYQARHLPWYDDSSHPTEEMKWYRSHMSPGTGFWRNNSIEGRYKD